MRQIAVELPMMAVVAAIIAILVLVAGGSIESPEQPHALVNRAMHSADAEGERCLNAPVSAPSGPATEGRATLCHHGATIRLSLQASILNPGERYTALLTYIALPLTCGAALCRPLDLPDERQLGLSVRINDVVVSPSRVVVVHAELPDTHLPTGAQISLMLLPPNEQTGQASQAMFTVP